MSEMADEIKEITDRWVERQQRLIDKKIRAGANPVIVYSAGMSTAVNTLVNMIMKFDAHAHQSMIQDMGKMIVGLYASKMEAEKIDRPRLILPSQMN